MCLITLSWQPGGKTPLVVAANRDEFYARSALALHRWPDQHILAGQDEKAGGTWLGVGWSRPPGEKTLRFAALTNYRDIHHNNPDAPSRGHITKAFLNSTISAAAYLEALAKTAKVYNPFNLMVFDGHALMGFESRHLRAFALPPGISSVSNADFNTPWPKLLHLHAGVEQALALADHDTLLEKTLFNLLSDEHVASDSELPKTGLSLERERTLSAAFIRTPD